MRIRQVKPAFWTDPTVAKASYPARLFYIGLWCVADDGGYIEWDAVQIGALLFPYEVPKVRERHISAWTRELTASGRLVLLDCGCMTVPTMPQHQRITGKQSFPTRDRHERMHRARGMGAPAGGPNDEGVTSHAQKSPNRGVRTYPSKQSVATGGSQALTDSPGTVGNGRERNVTERNGSAARDVKDNESEFRRLVPLPGKAS